MRSRLRPASIVCGDVDRLRRALSCISMTGKRTCAESVPIAIGVEGDIVVLLVCIHTYPPPACGKLSLWVLG